MSWLQEVTGKVASACGLDASTLAVAPSEARELLEIARIASHTSGDRTNAPLLCYVLGRAREQGASLEDMSRAVREADEA